jgi:hypothetical protein
MKRLTKKKAVAILREEVSAKRAWLGREPQWVVRHQEWPHHGDYGLDEVFSCEGDPVLRLRTCVGPPWCIATDLRGMSQEGVRKLQELG